MKFAIAAVFTLALVLGAQSSIIPIVPGLTQIAGGGLAYTAVSSPAAIPSAVAIQTLGGHAWITGHPGLVAAAPTVVATHPTVVAAPQTVVVAGPAPSGSYVAQTRGAVHSAPLPGHVQSVANLNVAPAPGTI